MKTNCNEETELPSCKIFQELNTRNGDPVNSSNDCNNLLGRVNYPGILEICRKLELNLANFVSSVKRSNSLKYNCEFIHYWLFGEIFNNENLNDDSTLKGVISQFYHTWENVVKSLKPEKKCEPKMELFKSITVNDLKFKKVMHDYVYNYDSFCEMTFDNEQIDNKYCKYLPSMRERYEKFKESCPQNTKRCFHVDKTLEEYSPDNLCKKFQCKEDASCSKYFEVAQEQSQAGEAESPDTGDSEADALMEKSETSTILTTVGPSLLGLFMSSFILFKLTPIRSWLNNQILKNRKFEEYMDDQSRNELLNDYFIHEDTGSEEKGYGIAYHSA
ncbi:Plasmodium vivax Vir protein, putative [Plasmodium ovale]|uniref:Plasmodium vivax Vir protein, putative n=1 Tax=Plasmodium ovale TaxID=36330 RepID=A0A1C3KI99_PLAOA|nr:Plasmodium vivax Vir protein, putative [Plasmodium ovale]